MLDFIRKHQKWVLVIIGLFIIPSFTFLGVSGYQNMTSQSRVLATVGKTKITQDMFNQQWNQSLNNMIASANEQQAKLPEAQRQVVDPKSFNTLENRQMVFQQLLNSYVVGEAVVKGYYKGTPLLVASYLKSNPMFLDQQGRFSREQYNQFLSLRGLKAADYEAYLAAVDIPREQVVQASSMAVYTSQKLRDEMAYQMNKVYTASLKLVEAKSFEPNVEVNDTLLKAWYETHKSEFKSPEYVDVEYLVMNEAAAMASVTPPTDEELKQFFESNKHLYQKGTDARRISILLVSSKTPEAKKTADDLYKVLQSDPTQFEALVKEHSDDLSTKTMKGVLGQFSQSDRSKFPELTQAFEMSEDAILPPVVVPQGQMIVRVDKIKLPVQATFEESKDALLKEALKQKAGEQFAGMLDTMQNDGRAYEGGLDLVAQKLHLQVQSTDGVSLGGLLPLDRLPKEAVRGQYLDIFNSLAVRNSLFEKDILSKKYNTNVIALDTSDYVVLHVKSVHPAAVPSFDMVKSQVKSAYIKEKSFELAKVATDDLLLQLSQHKQPVSFAKPMELNRLLIQDWPVEALTALQKTSEDSLPAYVSFKNAKGYSLLKIVGIKQSEANKEVIDYLMNSVIQRSLSQTQTKDTLDALRDQLGVDLDQDNIQKVVNTIEDNQK
ncbi:MAG: SurA N-terminal domain-containing protein [Alcaligenaceae bacterium]|nr:SurA N-terminal domain-containing protein [Alcaligenaceae bacterium]